MDIKSPTVDIESRIGDNESPIVDIESQIGDIESPIGDIESPSRDIYPIKDWGCLNHDNSSGEKTLKLPIEKNITNWRFDISNMG